MRSGSAPYSVDQIPRLGAGVGDQPIRLGDHLLLADQPAAGLRLVVVGHRGVLDLGQGVRRVHQRHSPAVLGQVSDLTGEPVVRVHDVVVAGRAARLGPHHPGRERAQLAGEFLLVQPLERPGHDVPDQHAGCQLGDRRLIRRRRPGEDLHLDAAGGQPPGRLVDVDVHPARVTGARLGHRRGVQRDGGQSPDSGGRPAVCGPPVGFGIPVVRGRVFSHDRRQRTAGDPGPAPGYRAESFCQSAKE